MIRQIAIFASRDEKKFIEQVTTAIEREQAKGLKVEVQYNATTHSFSALIITHDL